MVAVGSLRSLLEPRRWTRWGCGSSRTAALPRGRSVLARNPSLWIAAGYRVALILMNAPLVAFAAAWGDGDPAGRLQPGPRLQPGASEQGLLRPLDRAEMRGYLREFFPVCCWPDSRPWSTCASTSSCCPRCCRRRGLRGHEHLFGRGEALGDLVLGAGGHHRFGGAGYLPNPSCATKALFEARFQRLTDFSGPGGPGLRRPGRRDRALDDPPALRAGLRRVLPPPSWPCTPGPGSSSASGWILNQWCNLHRRNGLLFAATAVGAALNVALELPIDPALRRAGFGLGHPDLLRGHGQPVPALVPVAAAGGAGPAPDPVACWLKPGRLIAELLAQERMTSPGAYP